MIDRIRYEERRYDIDGVVIMTQENDAAEEDGGKQTEYAHRTVFPKYECHQERTAGMTGEEQIRSRCEDGGKK